ncbi:protein NEOXANTHIN-DEFICIENT 1 isoform X2 [Hevea brasiliensis]|uniref:protein NEOXANTHIN-DEFICIENT 1 isoform X2 n=1 Tax=Hevea brasiliensis TaxID=3981 RepID=UPI0025E0D43D|nr:protein NEOXANTHIN-DEFICIENT 1 isoform X2 [Hevea brasiliensis]
MTRSGYQAKTKAHKDMRNSVHDCWRLCCVGCFYALCGSMSACDHQSPLERKLVYGFHRGYRYTLGGFFLANYEESPAGAFDELVVIAGIVWNPPMSCAWAARVLVSSDDACGHGRKEVGLPSQVAKFSKRIAVIPLQQRSKSNHFLNMIGLSTAHSDSMDVQVTEINGPSAINICNINLATVVPGLKLDKRMGPAIKMSLPSFSGRTKHNPNLLKYSCNIECRVRSVQPAKVSRLFPASKHDTEESLGHHKCKSGDAINGELLDYGQSLSISVMLSKPILALQFSCLKMQVEAPIAVSHCSKSSCRTSLGVS